MKPIIGITTSFENERQSIKLDYVRAVERAGGIPIIVPAAKEWETMQTVGKLLHGLVISGGPAVTSGMIGELPPDIDDVDDVRLATDQAILRSFLESRKPILGICYGMQLVNATFGGKIYADVQRQHEGAVGHTERRGGVDHGVTFSDESWIAKALNTGYMSVNTRHIQAVAEPGDGLVVTGHSTDGVIEAIEDETGDILGVQFHPEAMGKPAAGLFTHLVQRARVRMSGGTH